MGHPSDAQSANDSASVRVTVLAAPVADLVLTQAAVLSADGRSPLFLVRVASQGPEWADGARVFDALLAALEDVVWFCNGTAAAVCATDGAGHVDDRVTLPPGGRVDYVVLTTLPAAFAGRLTNTATVTPPPGVYDPDPASNSDTVTLDCFADQAFCWSAFFTDGFESGDLTAWSAVAGGGP